MPIGTSLLLRSPGPASPAPSSAADSRQSRLLSNDQEVRPGPSPFPGSPRSHAVPAGPPVAAPSGRTHFLKSHLLGTPPRTSTAATASDIPTPHPPGVCLPESPCLPPGHSRGGTPGCGIIRRARGLLSMYNHHPSTHGAAGWGGRVAPSGSPQQDLYPSSSCIRHQRREPGLRPSTPLHPLCRHAPQGQTWGAEGTPEEGRGVHAGACMCARQGEGSGAGSAGGVASARHRLTGEGCPLP